MSPLFVKEPKKISLMVDIGSASVATGLLVTSKEKKPEIICNKRTYIRNGEKKLSPKILIKNLNKTLNTVLKEGAEILKTTEKKIRNGRIKEIVCVFSSPWSSFEVKTLESKKEKSERVTETTIDNIIKNDLKAYSNSENELTEKSVIRTKLNGYTAKNPFNKKAKEIEISVVEGTVKKEILEEVEKVLSTMGSEEIFFHTLGFVTLMTVSEIFSREENCLIVDVTGETTEVILTNQGVPVSSSSFPGGNNSFIKNIADEFVVDSDIALSFIKLYYEKRTEANFRNKAEKIVKKTEKKWLTNFEQALKDLKKDSSLPSKIFLIVEPRLSHPFPDMINNTYNKQLSKNVEITLLSNQDLSPFCKFSGNYDPFLAIESVFLGKISNKD